MTMQDLLGFLVTAAGFTALIMLAIVFFRRR